MLFDSDEESNGSSHFGLIGGKKSEIVLQFFYYHAVPHALHHDRSKSTRMERYDLEGKENNKNLQKRKINKNKNKNVKSLDLLPLINIR